MVLSWACKELVTKKQMAATSAALVAKLPVPYGTTDTSANEYYKKLIGAVTSDELFESFNLHAARKIGIRGVVVSAASVKKWLLGTALPIIADLPRFQGNKNGLIAIQTVIGLGLQCDRKYIDNLLQVLGTTVSDTSSSEYLEHLALVIEYYTPVAIDEAGLTF
jgi:hypothetical protein